MKAFTLVAATVLLCIPMIGHAQNAAAPPAPKMGQACKADLQTFCPNLTAGPARHACIQTNISKMSSACQSAFNAMQAVAVDVRKVCGPDIRQYCKGMAAGPARHQCITTNQPKFSAACQSAMAQQPPAAQ